MVVRCDERRELPLVTIRCTLHGCSDGLDDRGREQVAEGGENGSMLRLGKVAAKQGSDVVIMGGLGLYSGG